MGLRVYGLWWYVILGGEREGVVDHELHVRDVETPAGVSDEGSGSRVQGPGFRIQGSGSRVQGAGFRVQGSGCRTNLVVILRGRGPRHSRDLVSGLGFRV